MTRLIVTALGFIAMGAALVIATALPTLKELEQLESKPELKMIDSTSILPITSDTLDSETIPPETKRSCNGIFEGDIIICDLTYYDVCLECCGKLDGITASGLRIQNGVQPEVPIAGCNWLPLGTIIEIDGVQHIVADRGAACMDKVGRMDIFEYRGHQQALQNGWTYGAKVEVIELPGRC